MADPKLTDAERLWLDRRRRGETQDQAGQRRNVGRARQWRQETGREPVPDASSLPDSVSAAERLQLARRRAGLALRALATALSVSKVTILDWERKADPRLVTYWKAFEK